LGFGLYRTVAVAAAAACCLLLHAPVAQAQAERFGLLLGYSATWDDNVFRLPDSAPDPQADPGTSGKSDRYQTASVGLYADLPFSMQRIRLDLTRAAVRYDKFASRDSDPFRYSGAWQWQVTPYVSGTLNASRAQTDVNVEDVVGRRAIEQRTTIVGGTVDVWLGGGWHVLGGASESESKYSEPFLARPNTAQRTADVGLRYIFRSSSQLSLHRRRTPGTETVTDPAVFGGSDFVQDETEVNATWVASGHSTLNARVTRIERRNEVLPQRNFSGTAGELRYLWRATGRLNFDLSGRRNISPYNLSLVSTTQVENTLTAAATWATTERIAVRSAFSRSVSRYGQASTEFEARRDTTQTFEIGAGWSPRRYVTLDARLRHENRESTDPTQIYDANTATIALNLTF
jgi:exopolysaccharide biosynthesis operon protein EpsL